jgi:hypothetical protein
MQGTHLNQSASNEDTVLLEFGKTTINTDFTFRAQVPEKLAPDSMEPQPTQNLKRPKGHPDGPSPPSSPEKKRTRENTTSSRDTLTPVLLFPPQASSQISNMSDTMFGKPTMAPSLKRNAKLESFFTPESAEAKKQRITLDFERIAADKELQEFRDTYEAERRKAQRRQFDRERQSKHRDIVRTQKIADGWQPHQKRVSLL